MILNPTKSNANNAAYIYLIEKNTNMRSQIQQPLDRFIKKVSSQYKKYYNLNYLFSNLLVYFISAFIFIPCEMLCIYSRTSFFYHFNNLLEFLFICILTLRFHRKINAFRDRIIGYIKSLYKVYVGLCININLFSLITLTSCCTYKSDNKT
jgi:hypothetical protein